MELFIIGFTGSGKSTFGRLLAKKLRYKFLDLDKLIEEREGQTVQELYKNLGNEAFRAIEADVLRSLKGLDYDVIVATGGGTPCYHNNMTWMNQQGVTIYLQASAPLLIGRLRQFQNKRPIVQFDSDEELKNSIYNRLEERRSYYEKAQLFLDAARPDPDEVKGFLNQNYECHF